MTAPTLIKFICPRGCGKTQETVATAIVTHECKATKPGEKRFVRLVVA